MDCPATDYAFKREYEVKWKSDCLISKKASFAVLLF
jgi:hypothetical protein